MSGGIAHQVGLISCLERYESAEILAQKFPAVQAWREVADKRHDAMFKMAMACGFDPAWSGLSSLEWCRKRAEVLKRVFPVHTASQDHPCGDAQERCHPSPRQAGGRGL